MTDIGCVSVIRSLAERVLGSLVCTRNMPDMYGGRKLTVSGKVGGLKYLFKRAEMWGPELLRVASALVKKDDVAWSIGANVGLFSKTAAYLAGTGGSVSELLLMGKCIE